MIKNYKKINILFPAIIIIIAFFSISKISFASTEIYFQKDVSEITKGDIFSVNLKISSSDKIINVIDGTIIYDKNVLEIKKVNIDNSLFSLWVKEPIFDNKIGELSFVGGIPGGFKGKDGQIIEITFKAQKEDSTIVDFKDVFSVFINDGKGTRINPWLKPLSLSISSKSNNVSQYILNYFLSLNMNYGYYVGIFILVVLFIIIKLFIKFKNKKDGK